MTDDIAQLIIEWQARALAQLAINTKQTRADRRVCRTAADTFQACADELRALDVPPNEMMQDFHFDFGSQEGLLDASSVDIEPGDMPITSGAVVE